MAVRKRMEPQTGFAEIAERRRREQAVRETHEPLLPSSSAPVDGVYRSWAALRSALWFDHVKGIRAPLSASLLCRRERNRSHDDESHRHALACSCCPYLVAGNTNQPLMRMKFSQKIGE
jgi:hypothetical protein